MSLPSVTILYFIGTFSTFSNYIDRFVRKLFEHRCFMESVICYKWLSHNSHDIGCNNTLLRGLI